MKTIIYDITRIIHSDALVYPGDDPILVDNLCKIDNNCPCNITNLEWTTHFLTHVDPPLHFIKDGRSLDDIPLDRFTGKSLVIEVDGDAVLPEHIPENVTGYNLLFKTRNSFEYDESKFNESHVYVSKEACEIAVERGINMVGIDYISIDRFGDESYPAHNTLLSNDVLILEGIDLSEVPLGEYFLFALPLKIKGGDGSPVRAVLTE